MMIIINKGFDEKDNYDNDGGKDTWRHSSVLNFIAKTFSLFLDSSRKFDLAAVLSLSPFTSN